MSNENTATDFAEIKGVPVEAQPEKEPQQMLLSAALEEVKDTIKPSTRAIRLATISRLLEKHTSQLEKVGQKFQPIQNQMNKISKMVQPLQKQLKTIEKQTDLIKQMQTQIRQLQKQVSEGQKQNQKIRTLLLSNVKKTSSTKNKITKTKRRK